MARKLNVIELRARHQHCITYADIVRGIVAGDWAEGNYDRHKHKVGPACSAPEDGICAAPSISAEVLMERMEHPEEHGDE